MFLILECEITVGKVYGAMLMYEHWKAYKSRREGNIASSLTSRQGVMQTLADDTDTRPSRLLHGHSMASIVSSISTKVSALCGEHVVRHTLIVYIHPFQGASSNRPNTQLENATPLTEAGQVNTLKCSYLFYSVAFMGEHHSQVEKNLQEKDIQHRVSQNNYDDVIEVSITESPKTTTFSATTDQSENSKPKPQLPYTDETTALLSGQSNCQKGVADEESNSHPSKSAPVASNIMSRTISTGGRNDSHSFADVSVKNSEESAYPKDLLPSSTLFQAMRELSRSQMALDRKQSSDVQDSRLLGGSTTNTSASSLADMEEILPGNVNSPSVNIIKSSSAGKGSHKIPGTKFRHAVRDNSGSTSTSAESIYLEDISVDRSRHRQSRKHRIMHQNAPHSSTPTPPPTTNSGTKSSNKRVTAGVNTSINSLVVSENRLRAISMPRLNKPEVPISSFYFALLLRPHMFCLAS